MVWSEGPRRVYSPELVAKRGASQSPLRRTAGHRHLQHLVGTDARATLISAPWPSTSSEASTRPAASHLNFPSCRWARPLMRPTTMLFRNLVSMDVEESIRANPIDGVVLLAGLRQDHARRCSWAPPVATCRHLDDLRRPHAQRQIPWSGHRFGNRRMALQRGCPPRRHDRM